MQVTRQCWKTISTALEAIEFQISQAEPCLPYKKRKDGICLFVIYIDDIIIVGNNKPIDEIIKCSKTVLASRKYKNLIVIWAWASFEVKTATKHG